MPGPRPGRQNRVMVTLADVRAVALPLPRTEEHLIRDWAKFRVGRIVYAAVSPDETIMGFGFPRDERPALIAAEPAGSSCIAQRSALPVDRRLDGEPRR